MARGEHQELQHGDSAERNRGGQGAAAKESGRVEDPERARAMAEAEDAVRRLIEHARGPGTRERLNERAVREGERAGEFYDAQQRILEKRNRDNATIMKIFARNSQPGHSFGFDELFIESPEVIRNIYAAAEVSQPENLLPDTIMVTPTAWGQIKQKDGILAMVKPIPEGETPHPQSFLDYLRENNLEDYQRLAEVFRGRRLDEGVGSEATSDESNV